MALVAVFMVTITLLQGKPEGLVPSHTPRITLIPTDIYTQVWTGTPAIAPTAIPTLISIHSPTPTNTSTSTPTRTFMPVPTPTETLPPDLGAAVNLVGEVNEFKCNEYKGLPRPPGIERKWCQKSDFEELRKHIAQRGEQQGVFFDNQEGPVQGKSDCLFLWGRYDKAIGIEEIDGIQMCAVERWAYLPKQIEEYISASVHIYACHLEAEGSLCIRVCNVQLIWHSDLDQEKWDDLIRGKYWPTPVPLTR
jgi:hypothetical protein